MKILKTDLIQNSNFNNDKYSLVFSGENRFKYLIPNQANFLKIYNKDNGILLTIVLAKDGVIGITITEANHILKLFDFELEE